MAAIRQNERHAAIVRCVKTTPIQETRNHRHGKSKLIDVKPELRGREKKTNAKS